ncbi:MAG: hypothetical protein GXX96_10495 [Planctomycetaceae bacterium]|nr:hypothetical protein [Planctomycetaceae bacterium]
MTWTITERRGAVTVWESRTADGDLRFAVTINHNGEPIRPPLNCEGSPSVKEAFQAAERADDPAETCQACGGPIGDCECEQIGEDDLMDDMGID